ncbi:MAG TPA: RNA-binding cell elongation regulator Jag/EloR [Roseiflexaceae bacterium]|jgi:spoIIIJ-associated protein|nr:RNA-binding cell elongation regulator Jag/EloR [Roseiflexaceae bacterium]
MKSIEISARTVAEAIQLALAQLGKDRDEVAIEVLEAGSDDEEALVRVTAVDDEEERAVSSPSAGSTDIDQIARRILEDLLERMDIHGYVTAVRGSVPDQRGDPEETITLHVEGADEDAMGLLIGRRGETLRSLQFMVNLLVSRKVQKWPQIVVDVGNYRQRRQESLEGLARRMADRVRQSGRALTLEPMGAYERRIVHLALRSDPTVYTQSTGEGENRKVVIHPAKS